MKRPRVIVLMGVAGAGKTTVGRELACRLGGQFVDADDFHPAANLEKMAAGVPLADEDRWPWLERLKNEVIDRTIEDEFCVLACSALKRSYRAVLGPGTAEIALVYLKVDRMVLEERLGRRENHFMKAGMLESQLLALEEPAAEEGMTIEICDSIANTVDAVIEACSLTGECL